MSSILFLLQRGSDDRLASFKWTMRIFGFILTLLLGVGYLVSCRYSFRFATTYNVNGI